MHPSSHWKVQTQPKALGSHFAQGKAMPAKNRAVAKGKAKRGVAKAQETAEQDALCEMNPMLIA